MKTNKSASDHYIFPDYSFKEGKCYYKGEYFGDITGEKPGLIEVVRKDGNRYADGERVVFHLVKGRAGE